MDETSILLTGEYWHQDFAGLVAGADCSVTLRALDSVSNGSSSDDRYQIVVVAQPRRNQFDAAELERLTQKFSPIPVVILCGSWCEGETRSGSPSPGIERVYWHQWAGRFQNFRKHLKMQQIGSWHLPRIASVSDRIQADLFKPNSIKPKQKIGISSLTHEGFSMLSEVIGSGNSVWVAPGVSDQVSAVQFSTICVEANSLTQATVQRIQGLQSNFPSTPLVLILNFPRRREFELAANLGVFELVSKPFQLSDLQFAVERAMSRKIASVA